MAPIYWLIFFLILIGIEIATMALTTIWFAGGALAAFILSFFGVSLEGQLAVFVIVSFVLLIFTRPWAARYLKGHITRTNADSLIGKEARVTEEINNRSGTGIVVVNGQEWTARAQDNSLVYPLQELVVVREIKGVKLIVGKDKEEN